jgi:hypothetical protein
MTKQLAFLLIILVILVIVVACIFACERKAGGQKVGGAKDHRPAGTWGPSPRTHAVYGSDAGLSDEQLAPLIHGARELGDEPEADITRFIVSV